MPAKKKDARPSVNDEEVYEALRRDGASKEKAARIANAAARDGRSAVGKRGAKAEDLDDRTKDELMDRARQLGVKGRSRMTKAQLIDAIRQ